MNCPVIYIAIGWPPPPMPVRRAALSKGTQWGKSVTRSHNATSKQCLLTSISHSQSALAHEMSLPIKQPSFRSVNEPANTAEMLACSGRFLRKQQKKLLKVKAGNWLPSKESNIPKSIVVYSATSSYMGWRHEWQSFFLNVLFALICSLRFVSIPLPALRQLSRNLSIAHVRNFNWQQIKLEVERPSKWGRFLVSYRIAAFPCSWYVITPATDIPALQQLPLFTFPSTFFRSPAQPHWQAQVVFVPREALLALNTASPYD